MLANIPPSTIRSIRRLRSCSTRSLVCGPHTLCGLTTMVFPSSMYGLKRSSQSAPEPANPSSVNAPRRAKIFSANSLDSSGSKKCGEMNTSYPCCFAPRKMRSMFSTVLFSVTLAPTAAQAAPFSLNTSFCGSMNTTAVRLRSSCIMTSRSQEGEQVGVDLILVGRAHPVWCPWVDLQRRVLHQLRREPRRRADRHDLIVVTVEHQRRHIDLGEIRGEIGLREGFDAEVGRRETGHHPLPPECLPHTLGDLGSRPVVPVEGHREIPPELRAIGDDAGSELVEDLDRQAAGVRRRLQHERRDGANQDGLRDATGAVAADVADDFAAARG